jgi:hypothetical protein
VGTWKVSNEQRREYYPKRKLRRRQRDNKGKTGKRKLGGAVLVSGTTSLANFLLVGAAAKSGRLRVVLRINLLYYLSLVWWAILSQRVGPELSVEECVSFSAVAVER